MLLKVIFKHFLNEKYCNTNVGRTKFEWFFDDFHQHFSDLLGALDYSVRLIYKLRVKMEIFSHTCCCNTNTKIVANALLILSNPLISTLRSNQEVRELKITRYCTLLDTECKSIILENWFLKIMVHGTLKITFFIIFFPLRIVKIE